MPRHLSVVSYPSTINLLITTFLSAVTLFMKFRKVGLSTNGDQDLLLLSQLTLVFIQVSEATTRDVLYKTLFLKMSQNLQEKTCIEVSFLIKWQV